MSVRDTPQKNRYLECRPCEDIFETNTLISTSSFLFPNVQVGDENREEMYAQDSIILVERNEKVDIQLNPWCVAQNLNHDMDNGKISEVQSLILAPPKILKVIENKPDLSLQNKMARNYDNTHGSNGTNHTRNICTDLIISHVHSCAEILQVDNQNSIIHDLFYGLIWFIYMMICIHMCDTMQSILIHLRDGCTFLNPLVNSSKPSKINNEGKNSEIQTLVHVESLDLKYMKNKSTHTEYL